MKKINKILIGVFIVLSLFTILYSLFSASAYYTNITRYFDDSRKTDGNSGYALERTSNEFIVDGCGSGTMLDTLTGLCWQKDMNATKGGSYDPDGDGKVQWSTVSNYAEPTWNNVTKVYFYPNGTNSSYLAFAYCEDLSLGSNIDWRLPSSNELHTLIDQIGTSGSTCTTLSGFGFTNCQNNYYWADREYRPFTSYAWIVNFNYGNDGSNDKTVTYYVVCVR